MSSAPTSHRTFRVLAVGPRVQGVPIVPGRVRPGPFQITNLQKKTPDGAPLDSPAASPSESHRGGHKQGLIREEAGQLRSHHIHRPSRRFTPPPRGGGEGINCGPKWHTGFCPRVSGGPPLAIPGKSLGGGGWWSAHKCEGWGWHTGGIRGWQALGPHEEVDGGAQAAAAAGRPQADLQRRQQCKLQRGAALPRHYRAVRLLHVPHLLPPLVPAGGPGRKGKGPAGVGQLEAALDRGEYSALGEFRS